DQAQARVRQVQEQVRAAGSRIKKAEANEKAANARIDQMQSRFGASQAKREQGKAEIAAAGARISQAESEVEAARATERAMRAAAEGAGHAVEHAAESVTEARASAAAAQIVKGYTEIRATVDGVVTQRNISPGVLVGPGQSILKIAQLHPIRIQAS